MTDSEMLELAAKAAGYDVRWHEQWACYVHVAPHNTDNPPSLAGQRQVWVPLTDDGDALRLAVKLGIRFQYDRNAPPELGLPRECATALINGRWYAKAPAHGGPEAATRRVIVRAAAELGKADQCR
ncbi:hypothetical protein [Acidovorax phage ACPWH]|nr:hypothetical protein [Acidovorax phage ACPWH]QXV72246.1 hypothetical protein Acf1_00049 [Acidovorax phage ACF1]